MDKSKFTDETLPCSLGSDSDTVKALGADRLASYNGTCSLYKSRADTADTLRTVAIVSNTVGAAALVGTVVYYFVDRGPSKKAAAHAAPPAFRASVSPLTGGGTAGLSVFGTF